MHGLERALHDGSQVSHTVFKSAMHGFGRALQEASRRQTIVEWVSRVCVDSGGRCKTGVGAKRLYSVRVGDAWIGWELQDASRRQTLIE